MHPVAKALWYIEAHLESDIGLDEIARFSGVSRHHLCRAFGALTGRSVMSHLRARRLGAAARRMAEGAPDILAVALDAGYGSHEAFTRAFRAAFGTTPEEVRSARTLDRITIVEPLRMTQTTSATPARPRVETGRALLLAGLSARYPFEANHGIPAQWQRFLPYVGTLPGEVGKTAYGVCRKADEEGRFDYVAAVEIARTAELPPELTLLRIPERRYAVFEHRGHISDMRETVHAIWNTSLPASGLAVADAPDFERYGEDFDGETGLGRVEIWIPLEDEG